MTRREWALTIGIAAAAGASGVALNIWRTSGDADAKAGAALFAVELPRLSGGTVSLAEWRGKVLAINFWATWCAPCREEIPVFIRLQERYRERGLQFVGIAIDHLPRVRAYAAELGINFPVLIAGMEGGVELMRNAGNRAGVLPYTLIYRRDGTIAARHAGAFNEAKLEPLLTPLF